MLLPWLILIPFIGGLLCFLTEKTGPLVPRWIALFTMLLELVLGLWLWAHGDYSLAPAPGAETAWTAEFQMNWIPCWQSPAPGAKCSATSASSTSTCCGSSAA
jgi:NADH-quinone oxidoreductase subunit M